MKKLLPSLFLLVFATGLFAQTSTQETQQLANFCKVWGFLKYHHPIVATGQLDWDHELMSRINEVNQLRSKQALNDYYLNWISSLGEIKPRKNYQPPKADSLRYNYDIAWLSDTSVFTDAVITQLKNIKTCEHSKNFYVQQARFIGNTSYKNEKPYIDSVYPSAEMRVLTLSRYWNIIEYFFPYKYRIGENWNSVLVDMIPKFKDAKDTLAYHLAMLELTVKINDSHARLSTKYTKRYFGTKWVPFQFRLMDDKAIVTELNNDTLCRRNDIQVGDVFISIGNKSIAELYKERRRFIGASNEATKQRNAFNVIFNGANDSAWVSFERNGSISNKYIYRYSFERVNFKWSDFATADTSKILEGNIGYLNLAHLMPSKTNDHLKRLKNTKALIIDVRNYPNGTMYQLARFLNSESKAFAKFSNPDLAYPGLYSYSPAYYCGKKQKHPYSGKVILLFNETTQSHAEFTLMALKTAPRVIGIGSQTAGADGNVSLITLPGNYKTYMTGIGVFYPDGRETQRIGIVPDIEIKPTMEGIKAHRDEVLERALEEARRD